MSSPQVFCHAKGINSRKNLRVKSTKGKAAEKKGQPVEQSSSVSRASVLTNFT